MASTKSLAAFDTFTLSASPQTDYWRKPPSVDVNNAPIKVWEVPYGSFTRARVSLKFEAERLYDQAGLIVLWPKDKLAAPEGSVKGKPKWLKAGIEFADERANLSTVAATEWADWSLLPLTTPDSRDGKSETKSSISTSCECTLEIERERVDPNGFTGLGSRSSLWVYLITTTSEGKEERTAVREVTWGFADAQEGNEETKIQIGVYTARPTKADADADSPKELVAHFEDFVLEAKAS